MTKPYPWQTNLSHNVDNSLYVCSYPVHSIHDAANFIVLDLPLLEIVSFAMNDNCSHDHNTCVPFCIWKTTSKQEATLSKYHAINSLALLFS